MGLHPGVRKPGLPDAQARVPTKVYYLICPLALVADSNLHYYVSRETFQEGLIVNIRLGRAEDYSDIRLFYNRVAANMEGSRLDAHWRVGEYPSDTYLIDSLYNDDLILIEDERGIIASTIVNNRFDPAYSIVDWPSHIADRYADSIHVFGVHPFARNQGHAHRLLWCAIQYSQVSGQRAVRVDVPAANKQAIKICLNFGFQTAYTVPQHFGSDVVYFHLMELPLYKM